MVGKELATHKGFRSATSGLGDRLQTFVPLSGSMLATVFGQWRKLRHALSGTIACDLTIDRLGRIRHSPDVCRTRDPPRDPLPYLRVWYDWTLNASV